jgi:hypothetical protein
LIPFRRTSYKLFALLFNQTFDDDVKDLKREMEVYKCVEAVEEFRVDWETRLKIGRNDTEVFRDTKKRIGEFEKSIAKLPDTNKGFGHIQLLCEHVKKYLIRIPREIESQINHNFKDTLMEDMRQLREELGKVSDVLEQFPTTLNIYVDQKNTLKYCEQKDTEFKERFDSCMDLYNQCKATSQTGADLDTMRNELTKLNKTLPNLRTVAG